MGRTSRWKSTVDEPESSGMAGAKSAPSTKAVMTRTATETTLTGLPPKKTLVRVF
jgi:hypothetical protein